MEKPEQPKKVGKKKVVKHRDEIVAFGKRLEKLRLNQDKPLTREALAFDTDLTRETIYRIEKGQMNFTIDVLLRLANAFNMSISELFGDEKE